MAAESKNDQFLKLKKLNSELRYSDAYPNVDVQYLLSSSTVKENIILKSKEAQKQFTSTYQIDELVPKQTDKQTIELYEKADTEQKNPLFTIKAPVMSDAKGQISDAITLEILKQESDTLQIAIHTDEAWLNDEARAYPVTIDPYVGTVRGKTRDTFISSGAPNNNFGSMGSVYIGNETSTYKTSRVLVDFDLPQLSKGDMVVRTELNMVQFPSGLNPSTGTMQINAYEMTSSWDEKAVTWNSINSAVNTAKNGPILDYFNTSQSMGGKSNTWDITKLAKSWYDGTKTKNGILLTASDEAAVIRNQYATSEYPDAEGVNPELFIRFVNNTGLEDYWSYHSQSAGRAGTGSVNDYTGNLVFQIPVAETTGELTPLDFSLVYSGDHSGTPFKDGQRGGIYGWGIQSSLSQRIDGIVESNGTNEAEKKKFAQLALAGYKFLYLDEDGTEHYFVTDPSNSSKYKDEDGFDLSLSTSGPTDEYYTLSYPDGSKKTFSLSGYLKKIYDKNGNFLNLTYNGGKFASITDGAGRVTTLDYTRFANLNSITTPDGKQTKFYYKTTETTETLLTSITHYDGKITRYTYDSDNRLQEAIDLDGSKILYSYQSTGSSPMVKNRITLVQEKSSDGAAGNSVGISYNPDNTSTFTYTKQSGSSTAETYSFDSYGRTFSILNSDKSATAYTITSKDAKDGTANKITQQAMTSAPVTNLLRDHSAELKNGTWAQSNWSSPGGQLTVDSTTAYLGTNSLKVTQNQASPTRAGAMQTLTSVSSGTYTLSAYAKTNQATGGRGAAVYAVAYNGGTELGTFTGKGISGTNDWQRISCTFTLPQGTNKLVVYAGLCYSNGTAWFDGLQLERGNVVNSYNLLENPDFSYATNSQPDAWTSVNFEPNDGMSATWLKMKGNPSKNKSLYQNVPINKSAGSIAFILSGRAKGNSIPLKAALDRHFALDLGLYFTDGTTQWNIVSFNPDSTGEQYTSNAVAASEGNQGKTIARVAFHIIYYKNANDVSFKDIQLNMDETGSAYTYNSSGKLITSKQNAQNNETYNYNSSSKELESAKSRNNEAYEYYYVGTSGIAAHQLKSARSAQTKIGMYYTYDGKGNVVDSKMGTISGSGAIDTTVPENPYLQTTQGYSANGNYVTSISDQRGKTTTYDIDGTTGLTNSVTDPKGNATNYTYDAGNYSLTGVSAQIRAGTVQNTYGYDSSDRLNRITHNGFDYGFSYDGFGNTTNIKVGSQSLITNTYAGNNGNMSNSTYGNGFQLGYGYDSYDRVTSVQKNGAAAYQYDYNARGNLARITDVTGGAASITELFYDIGDRLTRKTFGNDAEIKYSYDNMDRSKGIDYVFGGQSKTTSFSYGADSRKSLTTLLSGGKMTFSYDTLNRNTVTDLNPNPGDPTLRTKAEFLNVSGNRTTTLTGIYSNFRRVGSTNTILSQYQYTYDDNGNISTVTDAQNNVTTYTYDQLNQLVRADDQKAGTSIAYSYDVGGNITAVSTYAYTTGELGSPTNTISYAYDNANWKDLLTSYNGQSITYDQIGNPLIYRDGMSFTWEGRQLRTAAVNGKGISYAYNNDGIRTGKTVDGVTTEYLVDGRNVLAQKTGNDVLWFLYDSDGTRVGFTYNDTAYYYTKNAQGDVTGIVDSSANTVVEYSYDAWGKLLTTTGNMADTIGKLNPFLYRGYYFDSETRLYYLNSRYYDAQTGRFINADDTDILLEDQDNLTEHNLFAYCLNNPVNMADDDGYIAANVIGGIVGGVAGAALGYLLAKQLGLTGWKKWALISAATIGGAALGAVLGPYVARLGGQISAKLGIQSAKVAFKSIGKITTQKMSHINVSKHLWGKVLKKVTSSGIEKLINQAIKKGAWNTAKNGVTTISYKYGGEIIVVTGRVIDGIFKIGDAWVKR